MSSVVAETSADAANERITGAVKDYYGSVLKSSKDLKTTACTSGCRPPPQVQAAIARVPQEILDKFYGCGAPLPQGIEGLRVVDLGSGSGRDAYVAAALVGEQGSVTGVDTTPEQLEVARRHVGAYTAQLGYSRPNLRFVEGRIEDLTAAGLGPGTADLVISNCVVNLSPDKAAVLREAARVLAPGGELHFADVYADRRLGPEVRSHRVLWGECLAGALWVEDFLELAAAAGFTPPLLLSCSPFAVTDPELEGVLGGARFTSRTYRLFLGSGAAASAADSGSTWQARYKGTVADAAEAYTLDEATRLPAREWVAVPAPVAALLRESWLRRHVDVQEGPGSVTGTPQQPPAAATSSAQPPAGGSCCSGRRCG